MPFHIGQAVYLKAARRMCFVASLDATSISLVLARTL
jgi:hypothetical protein